MADLTLTGIRKSFGRTEVLHGIDTVIEKGSFVSLLGASGCGKSTLLRIVAGLETASAGRVEIAGQEVTALPPEARDISMMFQSYALLPHLSVAENVRFPLRMRGIGNREEQAARVAEALETVQLSAFANRKPSQLSGGQQQRVALARAIVSTPKVLLLDEALSNLDARLREDMQLELIEIHRKLGLTTLFVTHDQDEALSLSDRVILLDGGRVAQAGSPEEIYEAPQTAFAAEFLGAANLIPAEIGPRGTATLPGGQHLPVPENMLEGPALLAIRQEDLVLSAGGKGISARLKAQVFMGSRTRHVLDLDGHRLRALSLGRPGLVAGETVRLAVDPDRIAWLPPAPTDRPE